MDWHTDMRSTFNINAVFNNLCHNHSISLRLRRSLDEGECSTIVAYGSVV